MLAGQDGLPRASLSSLNRLVAGKFGLHLRGGGRRISVQRWPKMVCLMALQHPADGFLVMFRVWVLQKRGDEQIIRGHHTILVVDEY